MNELDYRNRLWDKVDAEFEKFKKEQLLASKESIFNSAYKIAKLSEFKIMCNPASNVFSLNEVKALLKERNPIHILYDFYMDSQAGFIDELYESIYERLSELESENIKNQTNKKIKEQEKFYSM